MVNGSPRIPGFNPRLAHVGLVVDKLALGQFFLRVLRISSVSYHSTNAFFFMVPQTLVCQGLVLIEDSRLHSDAPHSVCLFWTSDQPDAQTSI